MDYTWAFIVYTSNKIQFAKICRGNFYFQSSYQNRNHIKKNNSVWIWTKTLLHSGWMPFSHFYCMGILIQSRTSVWFLSITHWIGVSNGTAPVWPQEIKWKIIHKHYLFNIYLCMFVLFFFSSRVGWFELILYISLDFYLRSITIKWMKKSEWCDLNWASFATKWSFGSIDVCNHKDRKWK